MHAVTHRVLKMKESENEIIEKILNDDFAWSEAVNNSENFNDFNKVMPNSIFKKIIFNYGK